ncbi:hypothetical protein LSAT2_017664 [Lamellibrachia satsuma]|nr:hypothetical protein LSAT2_017664 [Lamellibrachia satsuma]
MGLRDKPAARSPGLGVSEDIPVPQQHWTHGRALTRICLLPDPWVMMSSLDTWTDIDEDLSTARPMDDDVIFGHMDGH